MKTILIAIAILAIPSGMARGQENKPAPQKPKTQVSTTTSPAAAPALTIKPKPQITFITPPTPVKRHRVFGGVFPLIHKSDNPLQLINPFAPASYGDGSKNVEIDPITGRARGIKALSIEF